MNHAILLLLCAACAPAGPFTDWERRLLEDLVLDEDATPVASPSLPGNKAALELGRALYFDKALSSDGTVSCQTCHDLDAGGDDGQPHSRGVDGEPSPRNSPSVLYAGFRPLCARLPITDGKRRCDADGFGWFGQVDLLWQQNEKPLTNGFMNEDPDPGAADARLRARVDGSYARLWSDAFVAEPHTATDGVAQALEVFLLSLDPGETKFQRVMRDDDDFTPAEARGAALFVGEAHCVECHYGPTLSDGMLHDAGLGERVRTPPLLGVAETAPYGHDGSLATLWQVVQHYRQGGTVITETLDARIRPLPTLDDEDVNDLVAFLGTFTGDRILSPIP